MMMTEAEVVAGLEEARLYESARDGVLDELRGIGSDLIRFLGGKGRLRTVLDVDDVHFRHTSKGLIIEIPKGHIEMSLDGQDTLTVEFFKKGGPFGRRRVKQFKAVSLDRLVSVLKKYSKVIQ